MHHSKLTTGSLPEYYKAFNSHIHQTSHHFSQLQQDKSEATEYFVFKCMKMWDECQFHEETHDEMLLDRITF